MIEISNYSSRLINDLCKHTPMHLLDPLLAVIVSRYPQALTDSALLAFLVPSRTRLALPNAVHLRNSTLKQIAYNCRDLVSLDLSDCVQVSNAVVRVILVECYQLEEFRLERCHRVTDAAFDMQQSPFQVLAGCLSLKAISLKGCPQVSGQIVHTLNSACRHLKYLNLSQCKQIESAKIQEIFVHNQLRFLNLSFIDEVSDVAFCSLPRISTDGYVSPLLNLNLGNSKITDESLFRMAYLASLVEIRLQFCSGLTDNGIVALSHHCRQLQFIDLKSTLISDVSVEAIARNSHEIRTLDLSWCGSISDAAIEYLPSCLHLEKLFLIWCSQLTDKAIASLERVITLKALEVQGCMLMTQDGVQALRESGIQCSF
jgi:hypothetical protein